jgi:hypothetical protein
MGLKSQWIERLRHPVPPTSGPVAGVTNDHIEYKG